MVYVILAIVVIFVVLSIMFNAIVLTLDNIETLENEIFILNNAVDDLYEKYDKLSNKGLTKVKK